MANITKEGDEVRLNTLGILVALVEVGSREEFDGTVNEGGLEG